MFVDLTSVLVRQSALVRLQELWLIILVIKIAHQLMRVEVVSLKIEWLRDLPSCVQRLLWEH